MAAFLLHQAHLTRDAHNSNVWSAADATWTLVQGIYGHNKHRREHSVQKPVRYAGFRITGYNIKQITLALSWALVIQHQSLKLARLSGQGFLQRLSLPRILGLLQRACFPQRADGPKA